MPDVDWTTVTRAGPGRGHAAAPARGRVFQGHDVSTVGPETAGIKAGLVEILSDLCVLRPSVFRTSRPPVEDDRDQGPERFAWHRQGASPGRIAAIHANTGQLHDEHEARADAHPTSFRKCAIVGRLPA